MLSRSRRGLRVFLPHSRQLTCRWQVPQPLGPLLPQPAFPQPSPEPSSGSGRKGVWKESLPPKVEASSSLAAPMPSSGLGKSA